MIAKRAALSDLLRGSWRLERTIHDAHTNAHWTGLGTALVSDIRGSADLLLAERIRISDGRMQLDASRSYVLRCVANGFSLLALDGTLLATIADVERDTPSAPYRCDRDVYRFSFALLPSGGWATNWEVTGGKALRIDSRYCP